MTAKERIKLADARCFHFSSPRTCGACIESAIDEAVKEELDRVESCLAAFYSDNQRNPPIIAELVDRYLDRSGAMLGRIREAAHQIAATIRERDRREA